mgnify:CR=1 FL=1
MNALQVDLRVAELLASRLCHDLVSPIGAVNNGMELLEEDLDPEMVGDAVKLASGSARQASATVQFYRLAFGQAGQQVEMDPAQLRRLAEGYLGPHKANLDWRADQLISDGPDGTGKLLLNLVALALEALPRGGTIVAGADLSDGVHIGVSAEGQAARLRDESAAALRPDADVGTLTPRSVQAYFTQLVATRLGGKLAVQDETDRLIFQVRLAG